jgi:hypothetical protein
MMGHFEYKWTPEISGTCKVFANFLGSESYWKSSVETALCVDAQAAPSPTATPLTQDTINTSVMTYIIVAAIAIIIAIAIVGLLILRKKT